MFKHRLGVGFFLRSRRLFVVKDFFSKLRRFLIAEDGPTAIEYALMLALIVIVCVAAAPEEAGEPALLPLIAAS